MAATPIPKAPQDTSTKIKIKYIKTLGGIKGSRQAPPDEKW